MWYWESVHLKRQLMYQLLIDEGLKMSAFEAGVRSVLVCQVCTGVGYGASSHLRRELVLKQRGSIHYG